MILQMKEQIDYKPVSQTRVLAILAAIYLPFSFISVGNLLFYGLDTVITVSRVCLV